MDLTLTSPVILVVMALILTALTLSFVRLVRGPSLPDRVVALDVISMLVVGFIAIYAIAAAESILLDAALVLALISFLGTIAFAFYIDKGASS